MVTVTASVRSRHYFSFIHISAAAEFARRSAEIELTPSTVGGKNPWRLDRCYAVGAVISSVGFLEALINEVFSDAAETTSLRLKGLGRRQRVLLADMWAHDVPKTARYPVLEKYDILLTLLRKVAFDKSSQPYQDARLLIDLRNALVHYEPEWISHRDDSDPDQKARHKFDKSLKGKFKTCPLTGAGNPFWPDGCIGYGCARWSVKTALSLTSAFFRRIHVKYPLAGGDWNLSLP
jgi:hypothetical protein